VRELLLTFATIRTFETESRCSAVHSNIIHCDVNVRRLRMQCKPLNGETAFVDTAAAFNALPAADRNYLETLHVIRRIDDRDSGFTAPLVRTNPLSGVKSLHSPWSCRRGGVPDLEIPVSWIHPFITLRVLCTPASALKVLVPCRLFSSTATHQTLVTRILVGMQGMSQEESGEVFDRIELHCLQPKFRYNHLHRPGDVTMWDNFMTLHAVPPIKSDVSSVDDARLMFRLSCKGDPCFSLPREDAQPWVDKHIAASYRTPFATQCLGGC
jgi:alpha-ketoglutarate-dependent taurine dioxygenase